MKTVPVPWLALALLLLVALAASTIAVGSRLDLRTARQGAEPYLAARDSARIARQAARAATDSTIAAHAAEDSLAALALARADSGRAEAERKHASAAARARELAKNQPELVALIDTLEAAVVVMGESNDSLKVEYARLDVRYDSLLAVTKRERTADSVAIAKADSVAGYWERTAVAALSRQDFDLFAWIPKGPLRIAAKGAGCAALGTLVGLAAEATQTEEDRSSAPLVGGLGTAAACGLAAAAF